MIAFGPSGFMQGQREAWCAVCKQPTQCDETGCLVCFEMEQKRLDYKAASSAKYRQNRRCSGQCINGEHHPKPRNGGVRCDWCKDVHRRGLAAVLSAPRFSRPRGKQ